MIGKKPLGNKRLLALGARIQPGNIRELSGPFPGMLRECPLPRAIPFDRLGRRALDIRIYDTLGNCTIRYGCFCSCPRSTSTAASDCGSSSASLPRSRSISLKVVLPLKVPFGVSRSSRWKRSTAAAVSAS